MTEEPLPPTPSPKKGESPHPPPFFGEGVGGRGFFLFRFLVFAVFLGLWTWKLLEPNPVPESLSAQLSVFSPGDWRFWAAKSLHVGGYVFLTILAITLPVPRYWKWYFVGLLALHGVATEIGQTFVSNRFGSVRDVLIDWFGIGLGVCAWRLLHPRQSTSSGAFRSS